MDMNLSKLQKLVKDREVWCAAVQGVTKSQTQTELKWYFVYLSSAQPSYLTLHLLPNILHTTRGPGEINFMVAWLCPLYSLKYSQKLGYLSAEQVPNIHLLNKLSG